MNFPLRGFNAASVNDDNDFCGFLHNDFFVFKFFRKFAAIIAAVARAHIHVNMGIHGDNFFFFFRKTGILRRKLINN